MKLDQAIQQHVERMPLVLQGAVLDFVLYLEQTAGRQAPADNDRRNLLSIALEKVAALNPYAEVDAAVWVREQRLERSLLGRN